MDTMVTVKATELNRMTRATGRPITTSRAQPLEIQQCTAEPAKDIHKRLIPFIVIA